MNLGFYMVMDYTQTVWSWLMVWRLEFYIAYILVFTLRKVFLSNVLMFGSIVGGGHDDP